MNFQSDLTGTYNLYPYTNFYDRIPIKRNLKLKRTSYYGHSNKSRVIFWDSIFVMDILRLIYSNHAKALCADFGFSSFYFNKEKGPWYRYATLFTYSWHWLNLWLLMLILFPWLLCIPSSFRQAFLLFISAYISSIIGFHRRTRAFINQLDTWVWRHNQTKHIRLFLFKPSNKQQD